MNKTQQILKERKRDFDCLHKEFPSRKEVHAHLDTTISLFLNSIKEEVDEKINEALGKTDVADAVENINAFKGKNLSHRAILEVLYLGHLQALDGVSTLISETISNIQTK